MNFREVTQDDLDFMADHSISRGKKQPEQVDFVYTLEHDGKPLAVGGFRLINLSTAWCWFDLSDLAGSHIHTVYRTIKEWSMVFAKEHNIKRLQAYVECDFPEAIRMAEHCGFTRESIMKNFTDEQDAFMYVRII